MDGSVTIAERRVSNDEILEHARRIAAALKDAGVAYSEAINLLMRNDIEFVTCMVAANLVGAVATLVWAGGGGVLIAAACDSAGGR